jgi:hypothetical protein
VLGSITIQYKSEYKPSNLVHLYNSPHDWQQNKPNEGLTDVPLLDHGFNSTYQKLRTDGDKGSNDKQPVIIRVRDLVSLTTPS